MVTLHKNMGVSICKNDENGAAAGKNTYFLKKREIK